MRKAKGYWKWLRVSGVLGILLISFQNCDSTHMAGTDLGSSGGGGFNQAVFNQLQAEALSVLQARCASCHDGTVGGETPDVLDVAGLRGIYVLPGLPQNSPLYLTMIDNSMPPGGGVSLLEKNKIRDWIQMMR